MRQHWTESMSKEQIDVKERTKCEMIGYSINKYKELYETDRSVIKLQDKSTSERL